MNYPNLSKYVTRMNTWNQMCEDAGRPSRVPRISLYFLTRAQAKKISDRLEMDFSPENLCCDGELRGADLQKKVDYLTAVRNELTALTATLK